MSPTYEMAAAGWGGVEWLESRGDSMVKNGFLSQAASGTDGNSTNQMLINQLKFAAAKSIRTSTIILATFNTIAAFATAMGILYDAYSRERRNNRSFKFTRSGFTFVPSTDVFPLILSLGITVQSATFAVAQSTGLDSLFGNGCTTIAQLMLPAAFIAPYIQVVFGLETTFRGLHKKKPFQPRRKWTVTICMTIVGLMILGNFLVADFDRSDDLCFSSLFYFLSHYAVGCFVALTIITSVLLVCGVVIFVRLSRSIKIEVTERVVASRMVYYMALATVSNAFVIPYFYAQSFLQAPQGGVNGTALTLSMVASVVSNVSGLMTGGLYLFLKSNTISTIGPRDKAGEYERQKMKSKIRRYDTGSGSLGSQSVRRAELTATPIGMDSEISLIGSAKAEEARLATNGGASPPPNPLRSNAVFPSATVPRPPEPVQIANSIPTATSGHMRKRSYSLFPGNAPSIKSSVSLLPATTYSPNSYANHFDNLKPPPSMGNLMNRHRRDSSMASSATVQIGLRLSNVNDIMMMPPSTISAKPPQVASSSESVYSLECPEERAKAAALKRPSPLVRQDITMSTASSDEETVVDDTPRRDPVKDSRMKTLPPVPPAEILSNDDESSDEDSESVYEDKPVTLSPTVYTPQPPQSPSKAKLPSPRGVGFTMLAKSNSTSSTRPKSPRSPPMAPPRRTTGDPAPRPTENKDWI